MTEDSFLLAIICLVWAALAALYAFVPMFSMPGSALVWGSGASVFLALFAVTRGRELALRKSKHNVSNISANQEGVEQ